MTYFKMYDAYHILKTLEPNNFGYCFWYHHLKDIYGTEFSKRKLRRELGRNKTRNKRIA
jgi:hypothetical protein